MTTKAPHAGALGIPAVDRYGVVAYGRLYSHDGAHPLSRADIPNMAALVGLAVAHNLRRVFVAGDAIAWLDLPERLPPTGRLEHPFTGTGHGVAFSPRELAPTITARWPRIPRKFAVLVPAWDPASPWYGLYSGRALWGALERFREAVGISWRLGVGNTAEALILSTHPPERGGTVLRRPPDPPPPARRGNTEAAYTWCRPLEANERAGSYVVGFDMNAQYLAAWSSLACGLGGLEHREGDPRGAEFRRLPGYYRVELASDAPDEYLPPPIKASGLWCHAETLALLLELGAVHHVYESFVYTEHARFLAGAYERLRDARTELARDSLSAAAGAALGAVKRIYQTEYGRLGAGYRFAKPDRWLRPEWRHGTIARARCNLYRRLVKIAAVSGARPFAINVDAVYFAARDPDARAFADSVTLPLGDELGKFHVIGAAPLTKELHRPRSARAVAKHVTEEGST